jgi:hypothetical protein
VGRHLAEFLGGGAGGGRVAGKGHDLCVGGVQTGARDRVVGFVEGAADHGIGGGGRSLGELHQR